jgi:NAD(P)-dependent dehydrogenase (short-subunit alcohol dehydrogenase family)
MASSDGIAMALNPSSGQKKLRRRDTMGKLDGKIALVTGGNSGIGLATAKRFVNEGAYVFITGRRKPELDAAVKEIGRNVTGVRGDVSNLGDLDRLFGQIRQEKGKLHIVFANAGVARFAPFGTISEEFYDSIFDINVKGLLFTVQKALPLLPDGASIILNASIVANKGLPTNSVYSATKAAVRSFARTWTTDLRNRHIRVNAVSPGSIDTPGLNDLLASSETGQQRMKMISDAVPLGRFGTPDEMARPWCFSHPMTAATSREQNCLWMAASRKCRPLEEEDKGGSQCPTAFRPLRYLNATLLAGGVPLQFAEARKSSRLILSKKPVDILLRVSDEWAV